jgi:tetratricopeptide (TPR) repeat protein
MARKVTIKNAVKKNNQQEVNIKLNELFELAVTHINCGEESFAKQALPILLKIVKEDPNFISTEGITAYSILGNIYSDNPKGMNKAIEYYTKALALTPDDAFSLQYRGFCYLDIGKKVEAIKDLKKAKVLGKKNNLAISPDLDYIIKSNT